MEYNQIRVIKPFVEYIKQEDNIAHIAKCARVCYGKENGDDDKTVNNLYKAKHFSMFRHSSIYAIGEVDDVIYDVIRQYSNSPYIKYIIKNKHIYIATNENFIIDLSNNYVSSVSTMLYNYIINNHVNADEFSNTETGFQLMRYTFIINTSIATSRELNRVSPNSISERSTRYCLANSICEPWWFKINGINEYDVKLKGDDIYLKDACSDEWVSEGQVEYKIFNNSTKEDVNIYFKSIISSFNGYNTLISIGSLKEEARALLPLVTYTKCVYTYSINEWRRIINNRVLDKTGRAHGDAKLIIGKVKSELEELGYEFS